MVFPTSHLPHRSRSDGADLRSIKRELDPSPTIIQISIRWIIFHIMGLEVEDAPATEMVIDQRISTCSFHYPGYSTVLQLGTSVRGSALKRCGQLLGLFVLMPP